MKRNYLSTTAIATFGLMAAAPQSNADIIFAGSNNNEFRALDTKTGTVSFGINMGLTYGIASPSNGLLTTLNGNAVSNFSYAFNRQTGAVSFGSMTSTSLPSNMSLFTGGTAFNDTNVTTYITRTNTAINPSVPRQIAAVNTTTGQVSTMAILGSGVGDGLGFWNNLFYTTDNASGHILSTSDFQNFTTVASYPNGVTSLRALDVENGKVYSLKANGDILTYNFSTQQWSTLPFSFGAFTGNSFGLEVVPTGRFPISFPHLAIVGPPNPAPGSLAVLGLAGILASRRQRTA